MKLPLTLSPKPHCAVTHLVSENLWFDVSEWVTAVRWNTSLHLSCLDWGNGGKLWRREMMCFHPTLHPFSKPLIPFKVKRAGAYPNIHQGRGRVPYTGRQSNTGLRGCLFHIIRNCQHQMPFTDCKFVCQDQVHDDRSFQLPPQKVFTDPASAIVWLLGDNAYFLSFCELN